MRRIIDKRQGFTLIELSIVLVIIGLLVGGILVGQDLIQAATIRAEISNYEKWTAAINTYRTKYNNLPGDDPNATALGLGIAGDGDNAIELGHGANPFEGLNVWQHLGAAGLIPGTYTGVTGGYGCYGASTYPLSKLAAYSNWNSSPSGYEFFTADYVGNDTNNGTYPYLGDKNLWLSFVSNDPASNQCAIGEARGGTSASILQRIDAKIDDGLPFTGRVRLMGQDGISDDTSLQIMCNFLSSCVYQGSPWSPPCATGTVADGGQYVNDDTNAACPIGYRVQ